MRILASIKLLTTLAAISVTLVYLKLKWKLTENFPVSGIFWSWTDNKLNQSFNVDEIIEDRTEEVDGPNTKYILFWNEAYGSTKYGVCCGRKPFAKCKVKDCHMTDKRDLLKDVTKYNLIQFHQRSIVDYDLPRERSPNQRYMMWMMESASYLFSFDSMNYGDFFNWTLTYRKDSDFYRPYGKLIQSKPLPFDSNNEKAFWNHLKAFGSKNRNIAKNKTKPIAWFVSNCQTESLREAYVEELRKFIKVWR